MKSSNFSIDHADCSVIVPSKDRISFLEDLLASLSTQSCLPKEVIVVDDCSEEPVKKHLEVSEYPFNLKIYRNDECRGPACSRNIGLHRSREHNILFIDDDCVADDLWVETMVKRLQDSPEKLGGIGGSVRAYDNDFYSRYFEFNQILEPRPHDQNHPLRIPYLVTANSAVKRDVIMKAGGFDENIKKAGGEDCAMSLKIAKLGYYFEREKKAIVLHKFRKGLKNFYNTFYWYGLGGRYVVDRYLPL